MSRTPPPPTTAFLLAHQDDELGCLPEIEAVLHSGGMAVCIFLTNCAGRGAEPNRRNRESLRALTRHGLAAADIHFLGTDLKVPDGALVEHLGKVDAALREALAAAAPVGRIVVHAWEGGHQDHDAAHLLGIGAAVRLGILNESRQFPLYRASRQGPFPYVAFAPLPQNGAVDVRRFSRLSGLRYLRTALGYRSQWRAVLGLLPFLVYRYACRPRQHLQPLSVARAADRPHTGRLLYEAMGRMTYRHFRERADAYLTFMRRAA
jgi:LmbE family N-acetylglucosaminyl deacetylase